MIARAFPYDRPCRFQKFEATETIVTIGTTIWKPGFKQLFFFHSLRNFLMCQLSPKFDILNIILPVSQHEITKSIHFYMYMVTFKLSGLILH